MKAVLPGQPESRLQALATGYWDARRITTYITGNAFVILGHRETLLQTIYDDDERVLDAIALDEGSGKIATCTADTIRIYRPLGQEEGVLKWSLQSSFVVDSPSAERPSPQGFVLSWGSAEELLVAQTSLHLYQTFSDPGRSWRQPLPSPAKFAAFSYDSAYIASAGYHDRLVKVWRRLSYGSDDVRFDFLYLAHPATVTNLKWRKPYHSDQTIDDVLYTFCVDNVLRIWTGSDSHGNQLLRLWGKIDLAASLQADALKSQPAPAVRLATIVDGRDFSAATEAAVQAGGPEGYKDAALRHLIEVANKNPEICIAFDSAGQMSAWAMENIGVSYEKSGEKSATIVRVALVSLKDDEFPGALAAPSSDPHTELVSYCDKSGGHFHLLVHRFDGTIEVFESNIARLFDPEQRTSSLRRQAIWSGHSASIQKIVRNFSGRAIVSRTADGESIVWRHSADEADTTLARKNALAGAGHIHRICLLRKGRFVVFLGHDDISTWDCRQAKPRLLGRLAYSISGKPLCLLILPRRNADDYSVAHIATVTSDKRGIVWEVKLPEYASSNANLKVAAHANGVRQDSYMKEFYRFGLEGAEDLAYVLPVDPAGSSPIVSGFLDVFARDVAVSYTNSGKVEFWTARVDPSRSCVEWLSTSSMATGIPEPALVSGSMRKKAALVNSTRTAVSIWDIRGARLEYAREFESHNAIQDLDWTATPDSQSILAVGFPYQVILLSQMRFDYLNKGPAWAAIREISIREYTPHPIGDSTWLGDGYLVIGAGNQLFAYDRRLDASSSMITNLRIPNKRNGTWDLFDVVQRLNGPLPTFHPQFLSQCILAGKSALVQRILLALHKTLKFYVEGEAMDDYLGLAMEEFYATKTGAARRMDSKEASSYFSRETSFDDGEEDGFSEDIAQAINEKLTKIAIPQLSGHEQIQLVDIVECVGIVEKQRRSMDENGARFVLFFRQHALRRGRTNEIHMSWREINWAYHSTSQDILVDFVSRQNHGTFGWEQARESGMFMWLTDLSAVRTQFEVIARNEYTKSEMKNPVDCSLFYLALRKKAVLQGLWRMAGWNREQGATQKLLANNFEDPRWKTTALKNAYALMSKRRFGYAAAFFLLADQLQDAVNVCLNQLKDLQLAIAIARVYEGDQGPVLYKVLKEEVLVIAGQEGNRWLASWAFWMLRRRDMAVRALITPVYTLLETPVSPDMKSRLFLTDDPALVILYAQLRQTTLQTLRGASKVTPKVEWEFVLHNARLYDRMGCDLLGLDLVRNWEFLNAAADVGAELGGEINPLKLLRRRSSLVVADIPVGRMAAGGMRSGGRQPPASPSVFEEPDTNSLLDNFGF